MMPRKSVKKKVDLKKLLTPKNYLVAGIILLVAAFWFFRNYFIVATINGQPISRFELSGRLYSQFGDQILESLINERLIMGAARQQGIFVTAEELDARQNEIEEKIQEQMSLEEALKLQGLTPTTFRRQLEIQLSIEKMFEKESTVSAEEIDNYVTDNAALFQESTDAAKMKKDATEILKQQKLNEKYQTWFEKVKQEAKVTKNI
ncbi:MAG: PpiC-type peptidyl-prolyl cis-trans isomerase [Candidatus Gottesmanbacteria bacterium GW2011_GWA2_43_14]|uniref:peptidylprolyl isomerase n=1 Tax=Candidatus Gottesmanbacteria bacterium GW2011_GWA2_43_14 TaxID=1618443 RepID=A0A0G1DKV2_9BACT|nr:MAG: PpiC-type peptidyl-prolyl cis-trans isomerase [Candidatus Gottesmanbacteria bacterium GW2011_GWA2_43_14]